MGGERTTCTLVVVVAGAESLGTGNLVAVVVDTEYRLASSPGLPRLLIAASDWKEGRLGRFCDPHYVTNDCQDAVQFKHWQHAPIINNGKEG